MKWKRFINTDYLIGDDGLVFSEKSSKVLTKIDDGRGYDAVTIWINGVSEKIKVHRLVAETWLIRDEEQLEVNHKDGNKKNNTVSNLEWCTHQDNITHAYNTGLLSIGESHPISKLKESDVECIIGLFILGLNNQEIANRYNIARGTISKIRQRKTWRHVLPDISFESTSVTNTAGGKLNADKVIEIRKMSKSGVTNSAIANYFKVHNGTIHSILSGKTWKNIK